MKFEIGISVDGSIRRRPIHGLTRDCDFQSNRIVSRLLRLLCQLKPSWGEKNEEPDASLELAEHRLSRMVQVPEILTN